MFEDYRVPTRPMTADDVLVVLQDDYRQAANIPPGVDPRVTVSFSTTVDDWFYARFDVMSFRRLGDSFNTWFKTAFTKEQWRRVLYPPKERTLRDICELVATDAEKPIIQPVCVLGRHCADAGAFLAIRKMLADAGADVNDLTPSSPVEPYLKQWSQVFFGDISRLAPGKLPAYEAIPKIKYGWFPRKAFGVSWLMGTLGLFVAMLFNAVRFWAGVTSACGFAIMGMYILFCIVSGPPHQRFGMVRTFRDLSKELAAGSD